MGADDEQKPNKCCNSYNIYMGADDEHKPNNMSTPTGVTPINFKPKPEHNPNKNPNTTRTLRPDQAASPCGKPCGKLIHRHLWKCGKPTHKACKLLLTLVT